MKIGLVSSAVPLINGGGRFIADWLESELRGRGHQVETVLIPSTENPETVLQQMIAFRTINLSDAYERVITFRPPAHVVQHPNKVVWFIHHFRQFYDLWGTSYCGCPDTAPGRALRAQIFTADNVALNAARRVFTNSRVVKDRLAHFNAIDSEVLYPPVLAPERFRSGEYRDEIISVCRLEPHKRQHMLVEALAHTRTPVRLRLCGAGSSPAYVHELNETARRLGVADRVSIENRWITEDEKVDLLETALASAYVPFDEDSYGYPTIEAAHARRCTVSVTDSGGVPEFVTDGINGLITSPEPQAIAEAFDRLHVDRALARRMGESANERVAALGIDWDTVIGKLLS
jgi:glycosyltransferase involved in cell wall biosynthesis